MGTPKKDVRWWTKLALVAGTLLIAMIAAAALCANAERSLPLFALAALLAYAFQDLVSGLFHFFLDNYGHKGTPVFGPIIFGFRRHHVDPQFIVRENDAVLNMGDTAMLAMPVALASAVAAALQSPSGFFAASFLWSWALFVLVTQQVHAYAHDAKRPAWAALLQRIGVFVRPETHAAHHQPPFSRKFAIVCGWANPLLDGLGFFRRVAERRAPGLLAETERDLAALTRAG